MEIVNINTQIYPQISAIYMQGISTNIATFQTKAMNWNTWDETHLQFCRFALMQKENMYGWCALSPISKRDVYKGVAEVSIYIAASYLNMGIGTTLLMHLINESERFGIWTLQSNVFEENKASLNLHIKCGFRIVGTRERIGQLNGVWKNNVLMERRSLMI